MVFDYTLPPDHPWNNEWIEDIIGRKFTMEFTGTDNPRDTFVVGVGKPPKDIGGLILRLEAQ